MAAAKVGVDLRIPLKIEGLVRDAGFENVVCDPKKLPMGHWPKDQRLKTVGFCHREQFLQGLSGIAMGLLTRVMKWSREEVEVYLSQVRKDVNDRKVHGYWKVFVSPFHFLRVWFFVFGYYAADGRLEGRLMD